MEEFTYNDVVKYSILHPGDHILPCTAYVGVSNNEKPTQYEYACMYVHTCTETAP